MINFKKAHGLQVVSRQEGAIVGKLDDFQFDLESHAIYGYRIKGAGMFSKAGGVPAAALDQIGRDVAFIHKEDDVEWSGGARNAEDDRAWASQYRGTKVVSQSGASLGQVEDFIFDPASYAVRGLILSDHRMVELIDDAANTGPAAVVVPDPSKVVPVPAEHRSGEATDWWSRLTGGGSRDEGEAAE